MNIESGGGVKGSFKVSNGEPFGNKAKLKINNGNAKGKLKINGDTYKFNFNGNKAMKNIDLENIMDGVKGGLALGAGLGTLFAITGGKGKFVSSLAKFAALGAVSGGVGAAMYDSGIDVNPYVKTAVPGIIIGIAVGASAGGRAAFRAASIGGLAGVMGGANALNKYF